MNKVMGNIAMAEPIVSFDLKEARVSAGDGAVYAPVNDEAVFIAQLLDDPDTRARMAGELGREWVVAPRSWDVARSALLYEGVSQL
jgi:hypothetical protein